MIWYLAIAYFFGGAFLASASPHLIAGVSGRAFPSPFASPPFRGLSSAAVNVGWGSLNLAVAYALLVPVGELDIRSWQQVGVAFAGFVAMAFQCARSVGRLRARH